MIIRCEQCDTRFQLDDARIPEQGARVRCSLCKNAFFVRPPETSQEEAVHAVAAEAAATESAAAPSPAWDLDEAPDAPAAQEAHADPSETISEPPAEEEEESDWQFEEPVPGGPTEEDVDSAARLEPAQFAAPEPNPAAAEDLAPTPSEDETAVFSAALDGDRGGIFADEEESPVQAAAAAPEACDVEAPTPEAEPPPDEAEAPASLDTAADSYYDLDEPGATEASDELETDAEGEDVESLAKEADVEIGALGDPSSWDLEGELEAAGALDDVSDGEGWTWDADASSQAPVAAPVEAPVAPTGALGSLDSERRGLPVPLAQLTGWGAVLVLVAVGLLALLQSPPNSTDPLVSAPLPSRSVAGLEIDGLEARPIDNLSVGPLWVVSGRARNPGSGERVLGTGLSVQALGADGEPLAEAPAVPRIAAAVLRESHPAELNAAEPAGIRRLSQSTLAPGEWLVFDAVLGSLPPDAVGLAVKAAPVPEMPQSDADSEGLIVGGSGEAAS